MNKKRLRACVIGLGAMGKYHCECIRNRLPEMTLTAVVEPIETLAAPIVGRSRLRHFTNCTDMIKSGLCDLVTIATPHPMHDKIAVECMNAGLHVLSEKPLAESIAKADKMVEAAKRNNVVFGCIFQRRFEPVFMAAMQLVNDGLLGELLRASLVFSDFRSQAYYDSNIWRATWAGEGGGVLINQAPHYLDIFAQMTGLPETIIGRQDTIRHDIEVEDRAEALLRYKNGATGYIYASTTEDNDSIRMELIGNKGKLIINKDNIEAYRYSQPLDVLTKEATEMWERPSLVPVRIPLKKTPTGHHVVFRNFARHILHDTPLLCSGESACASLEIANAILLSSYTKKEVKLPISRRQVESQLNTLRKKSKPKKRTIRVQTVTDPTLK